MGEKIVEEERSRSTVFKSSNLPASFGKWGGNDICILPF